MVSRVQSAAVLLALGAWLAGPPAEAAATPTTVRVSFAQSARATAYLRFAGNQLRVAATQDALESAPSVRAKNTRREGGLGGPRLHVYEFPVVKLPAAPSGFSGASGSFTYYGSEDSTPGRGQGFVSISGQVTYTVRQEGTEWGYVVSTGAGAELPAGSREILDMRLPRLDVDRLTLDVVTKVERREARLGVQLKAGETDLYSVTKNGKPVSVRLAVASEAGRSVVKEDGDPVKFGFT